MKAAYSGRCQNGEVGPGIPAVGTDNLTLGDRVKLLRCNQHWTQVELSRRSGLSGTFISDVEANKAYPRSRSVAMLADGLGTTSAFLVYGPSATSAASAAIDESPHIDEPKFELKPANAPDPDDDIFQPAPAAAVVPTKKKVRIQCFGDQLNSVLNTIVPDYSDAKHVNIEIERGEMDSAVVLIEFTK